MLQIEQAVGGMTIFIWIGATIVLLSQGGFGDAGLLALLMIPIGGLVALILSGILICILRLITITVKYLRSND